MFFDISFVLMGSSDEPAKLTYSSRPGGRAELPLIYSGALRRKSVFVRCVARVQLRTVFDVRMGVRTENCKVIFLDRRNGNVAVCRKSRYIIY